MTTVAIQMHRVTAFELGGDYIIRLTFDDGFERSIDLEPILHGPIFGQLRDQKLFDAVTLDSDFGALAWPNGADIDPAVLYNWPDHVERIAKRHKNTSRT